MTNDQFDKLLPRMQKHSLQSIEIARKVLVENKTQAEIARLYKITPQRVNNMLSRIKKSIEQVPLNWKEVHVWLPPEKAKIVYRMEAKAKESLK